MTAPTAAGRPLTTAQSVILGTAAVAMLALGALGAAGTYSNLRTAFPRSATALGAVVAGEGGTLILALVYVGLVMLGQSAPAAVRLGLWALPAVAATVGAVAAHGPAATVVYAVTPLAMVCGAEGAGLLARRIVVATTGIDVEARRRGAATVRRLAYERARADHHPSRTVQWVAERRAWRLAGRVGTGDTALDEQLLDVQRARLAQGADAALTAMLGTPRPAVTPDRDAVTAPVTPALDPAPDAPAEQPPPADPVTPEPEPVTDPGTQASGTADEQPEQPVTPTVTLADLATVAGVPVPEPGVPLTDEQLDLVLRWLRYQTDPPLSYRQARNAFRVAGFVGAEDRIRPAYAALVTREKQDDEPTD